MKIQLYLIEYELIFAGIWNCLFFPNVGERLYIFPFLSEEERKTVSAIKYGEQTDDMPEIAFKQEYQGISLLKMLSQCPCLIEQKMWKYENNEWICSFFLRM